MKELFEASAYTLRVPGLLQNPVLTPLQGTTTLQAKLAHFYREHLQNTHTPKDPTVDDINPALPRIRNIP